MVNMLANIDVMMWLQYAYVDAVMSHVVSAVIIFLVAMVVGVFLIGFVWGKGWSKTWSLTATSLRITWILALSIVGSWSLVAVDNLYGSHFFNISLGAQMQAMQKTAMISKDDDMSDKLNKSEGGDFLITFYKEHVSPKLPAIGKPGLNNNVALAPKVVSQIIGAHEDALVSAWSLAILSFLGLILSVAFISFGGIKAIKPAIVSNNN